MDRRIISFVSAIFLTFLTTCLYAQAETAQGVVTQSVENMFSKPSTKLDVVSQALLGTTVKILKTEKDEQGKDWYYIETPDTYQGWIDSRAIRLYKPGEKPYAASGQVIEITSLMAFVYATPDVTEQKPLKMAPISTVLEIGQPEERWVAVTLPCGHKGFIQVGDGEIKQAPFKRSRLSPEQMVALAIRFLGIPYLWGGTSPLGVDCSGFAQLIYRLSGVEILRDAGIQYTSSGLLEIPKGQEKAGDLIFFGGKSISHVGMMISDHEFIHATTHEKPVVQISGLRDAYWQRIYQGCRRAPQ
ncbi:MAG TPA: SH3 domain-containing C40 family peptidase [Candidatus Saccharicenans sp.]|jgi:cell wall-associated NlpC family hydrolase|nr:C40 family peptidase [Candidatus Saccharicenans sp.]HRD02219.1 SH3 domain-containing C40 family peptidase [Candidatus Saccharicenans sp.]